MSGAPHDNRNYPDDEGNVEGHPDRNANRNPEQYGSPGTPDPYAQGGPGGPGGPYGQERPQAWGTGEYDADATAFVQLPPDGLPPQDMPLAAPGTGQGGYTPPPIDPTPPHGSPMTPAAATDPSATGHWTMPFAGTAPEASGHAPAAEPEAEPEQETYGGPAAALGQGAAAALAGSHEARTQRRPLGEGGGAGTPGVPGSDPAVPGTGVPGGEPAVPGAPSVPGTPGVPGAGGTVADAGAVAEPWQAEPAPMTPAAPPAPAPAPEEWPGAAPVPAQPEPALSEPEPGPAPSPEPSREVAVEAAEPVGAEPSPEPGADAAEADADDPFAPNTPAVDSEHPHTSYVLHVNGVDRPVTSAWIGESLLYVLRERLGLAGAKDGCAQGECGACSVQVDGRLVASCLVPAATTAGCEIRTVEGLASGGVPSDVQCALAESGSVQCGFCVPGLAMTVHDLLEGNHAPSELETRQAISGNLCRCSGYRGVLDAVQKVVSDRSAQAASAEGAGGHDAEIPQQARHPEWGGA
ncbi:hypothetical protein GCM10009801_56380 [Streptomyces albiaxialis]|uniref:2Fe-2S ferredoxin-type domain-containing protein n=1 Tax=Streptomyces albiaxialis TaxID=329523 RepID=A0ABN2WF56_9ACTN